MLAFLGALPLIGSLVTGITSAFFDAKVRITQARIGGDRDVAVQIIKSQEVADQQRVAGLAVIASNKLLTILVIAFATPLVIFMWKVVVWDIVLNLGSTDPIRGQVAEWANTIIWAIFGTSTSLALGRMWFGRSAA